MSRHQSLLAAGPLDDEDLLQEILLRLPPKPSSFPRASLVCKRWRCILSDPRFLCRFRKHHRKPMLLGFFDKGWGQATVFAPMLDPPDRASFVLPENLLALEPQAISFFGCRHGIALFLDRKRQEAVLWDPITGVQRRVAVPSRFRDGKHKFIRSAALVCSAGDEHHVYGDCNMSPFKLVLACRDAKSTKAFVCIYESKSGIWGNIISTATTNAIFCRRPSILVGNALCWLLVGGDILQLDFAKLNLVVIEKPADTHGNGTGYLHLDWYSQVLRGEDNGLGLAVLSMSKLSIQLWAWKSNCDGVFSWDLQNTVQLDELFSRPACSRGVLMPGYDEDTNAIFLSSDSHDFILQLESMQFNYIGGRKYEGYSMYFPYTHFYIAGSGIAAGDGGLKM